MRSKIVETRCLLIDACAGTVLEPLPGARFRLVCSLDAAGRGSAALVTVADAARHLGFKPKTLYNMIADGRLRREHGLVRVGRSTRINLGKLDAALDKRIDIAKVDAAIELSNGKG
jgi:excisionase family DNA binding protein